MKGARPLTMCSYNSIRPGKSALGTSLINADSANNLRLKIKLAGLKVRMQRQPCSTKTKEMKRALKSRGTDEPRGRQETMMTDREELPLSLTQATRCMKPRLRLIRSEFEIRGDLIQRSLQSISSHTRPGRASAGNQAPHRCLATPLDSTIYSEPFAPAPMLLDLPGGEAPVLPVVRAEGRPFHQPPRYPESVANHTTGANKELFE